MLCVRTKEGLHKALASTDDHIREGVGGESSARPVHCSEAITLSTSGRGPESSGSCGRVNK